MSELRRERVQALRDMLKTGEQTHTFVQLNPSSYAAVFSGKTTGHSTFEDEVAFHSAFPNDTVIATHMDVEKLIGELKWTRKRLREDSDGTVYWEDTLKIPTGTKRRIMADKFGQIPWMVEPPVKEPSDFDLVDFYADRIREQAPALARAHAHYPAQFERMGFGAGMVILSAFEAYWLIDYAEAPIFLMDWPDRYLASIRKIHRANIAMLEEMRKVGFEFFYAGSAGLELLSPQTFEQGIIPFQREFNDRVRELGGFSSHHTCGRSRLMIEKGIIDRIKPCIFETCSGPPCGDNDDLAAAVNGIDEEIVTKGNLALELMRNGTPEEIRGEVARIRDATKGRRHIISQADATILTGTSPENIRAFVEAAAAPFRFSQAVASGRAAQ